MKSLLREIHRQPEHIRQIVAGLCTVTTVSFVALIWFQSFRSNTYALLNPGQENPADQEYFANNSTSLFGYIGKAISDSRALLGGGKEVEADLTQKKSAEAVHLLPVWGNR